MEVHSFMERGKIVLLIIAQQQMDKQSDGWTKTRTFNKFVTGGFR